MTVQRAGALTTVQDLGRPGHRAAGVPVGGAVDSVSLRLANLVVGNDENAAGLECTLAGPSLSFSADAILAIGGAQVAGVQSLRPIRVRRSEMLSLVRIVSGCRAYIAIAGGGIDVPPVLGSRSTELRSGWGGFQGRSLRDGDIVKLMSIPFVDPASFTISAPPAREDTLRIVRGEAWDDEALAGQFIVTTQSDRMGVRLQGEAKRRRKHGGQQQFSAAVVPGAIQLPPDCNPIVLLADAQTIGGYPVVAHVIAADLLAAAQLRPGERVSFREVSLEGARAAWRGQQRWLAIVRQGIMNARRV
jgi:antagonist of KipI